MVYNLRVSGIVEESIVDGPGLRFVIFTQGCQHFCKGCHNPETHDLNGGKLTDTEVILARFSENPLLAGVTFSGGEPFLQPEPLCHIADAVKKLGKNIVIYTGYTIEKLVTMSETRPEIRRLLESADLLIDGPYVNALRDLELRYRGSSNQRILDKTKIQEFFATPPSEKVVCCR